MIDYISANQLHVPLQDELFADLCEVSLTDNIASVDVRKRDVFNRKPIERVRSGRSAKHSGNLQPEEPFVPYCNVYSVKQEMFESSIGVRKQSASAPSCEGLSTEGMQYNEPRDFVKCSSIDELRLKLQKGRICYTFYSA